MISFCIEGSISILSLMKLLDVMGSKLLPSYLCAARHHYASPAVRLVRHIECHCREPTDENRNWPAGRWRNSQDRFNLIAMPFTIDRLDHLVLTVADIDVTIDFYTNALGMQAVSFGDRKALTFGAQKINLHERGHD